MSLLRIFSTVFLVFLISVLWNTEVGEVYAVVAVPNPVEKTVWKEIGEKVVTAYSKIETCPYRVCRTASGKIASKGMIACPRSMKFGTILKINDTEYSCEDRTALRFDGRIDIYFGDNEEDYQEALQFGKQLKTIYENTESI